MAVRKPLYVDSGNLREMDTTKVAEIVDQAAATTQRLGSALSPAPMASASLVSKLHPAPSASQTPG